MTTSQTFGMKAEQAECPGAREQETALAVQDVKESRELAVIAAAQKAERHAQIDAVVGPISNAAMISNAFNLINPQNIGIADIANPVERIIGAVVSGDLSAMEAMLAAQAVALQTIFTSLAVKAGAQIKESNYQELLKLALRAQHQSRATIDTLTNLKFPRQIIMKQVNSSTGGPQQVVNDGGSSVRTDARLGGCGNPQSKLLPLQKEDTKYERLRLESGTEAAARGTDIKMETMAAVNRPEDTRGESPCCSKCLQGRYQGRTP